MVKANQKQRGVRPSQKRPHWYSWTTVFVFSANASHFIPKERNNCLPFFLVSLKRKPLKHTISQEEGGFCYLTWLWIVGRLDWCHQGARWRDWLQSGWSVSTLFYFNCGLRFDINLLDFIEFSRIVLGWSCSLAMQRYRMTESEWPCDS